MNSKKKILLNKTYIRFIQTSLNDLPLEGIEEFIDKDIMGYGTTLNEKIRSISEYRNLVMRQREQGRDIDMEYDLTLVIHKITADGNSAVFVDEIVIKMLIQNESHKLFLRLSTFLEYRDEKWIVVHWHGSKPEYEAAEADTWHINEWKQKNAELEKLVEEKTADLVNKNRELAIEAALERVRVVAMSMNKSEDLLNICEITFKELDKLGFNHLRNAVIHIPNDDQKYFMDYDFSEFTGGAISKIKYGLHPIVDEYSEKIRATNDAYFEVVIDKDQLDGWKEFRKKSGQIDDPRLDDADAIHYYLFSIGIGDIGISTFRPSNDSQIKILKRFRNVFDLAYKRYNDIALAEAQAKESQIEAGLERVRAKAMAMHKSDDLTSAVASVFTELDKLGLQTIRCGIGIFNDHSKKVNVWTASSNENGDNANLSGDEKLEGHPLLDKMFDAWVNQYELSYTLKGKDLAEYYRVISTDSNFPVKIPENINDDTLQYYYLVTFSAGGLYAFRENEFSSEAKILMKRFADVFQLSFTRHLDLKKAEAQAREAKVEAALERVRSLALGMRKSEEVGNVTDRLFKELINLNVDVSGGSIVVIDEDTDKMELWRARSNIAVKPFESTSFAGSMNLLKKYMPEWFPTFIEALERKKEYLMDELSADRRTQFINVIAEQYKYSDDEKAQLQKNAPENIITHYIFFKLGYLALVGEKKLSSENLSITRRFVEVFDFSYTRFLDLLNAEQQAREAKIEASLEKVRSKAMAMHNSEDLSLTIDHFFKELKNLNIKPIRCGVGIKDGESRIVNVTGTSATEKGDDIKITGKLRLTGHPILDKIYDALQVQEEYFPVLRGDEINEYYKVMNPDIEFPNFSKDDIQYGYYFHYQEGGVFAWTTKELLEEEINIFRRFKSVLSLTYRRYLDLKDAEAKTREAVIETALERVRSRTMAMQKSNELAQTAAHLFSQLNELGIKPYRCNIAIVNSESVSCQIWSTTNSGNVIPTVSNLPLNEYPVLINMYEGWENQIPNHVIKLIGEERLSWAQYISKHLPFEEYKPNKIDKESLKREAAYFSNFYFKQGFFTIHSKVELTEDQLKIIQRFAKVFEQTYTRFLDLEKAELQNRFIQAENERKTQELEEARQLQLAMLPKELPQLPNFDIAVYMQTATEVGGDYYDFHVDNNGVLTAVVGDATGHGMKAGTIVTITKSMFNSLAGEQNILNTFKNISRVIKDMKFSQLSMCLMMIKIKDDILSMSSAAMPPALIYRNKKKMVQEITLSGMPLGAMVNFPYKLEEIKLQSGDTILLMSDGFPELMNNNQKMFGYERAAQLFEKSADRSSQEIILALKTAASEWVNGKAPDDDVTFVVIKVK